MLRFEEFECEVAGWPYAGKGLHRTRTWRAKITGGWLVGRPDSDAGLTFVPDPDHAWDGNSLP